MPIFEYQCVTCGGVTSFLESRNAKAIHKCESCGSKKTKKIFSTFAAHSKSSSAGSCEIPSGGCGSGPCGSGQCGMN